MNKNGGNGRSEAIEMENIKSYLAAPTVPRIASH